MITSGASPPAQDHPAGLAVIARALGGDLQGLESPRSAALHIETAATSVVLRLNVPALIMSG